MCALRAEADQRDWEWPQHLFRLATFIQTFLTACRTSRGHFTHRAPDYLLIENHWKLHHAFGTIPARILVRLQSGVARSNNYNWLVHPLTPLPYDLLFPRCLPRQRKRLGSVAYIPVFRRHDVLHRVDSSSLLGNLHDHRLTRTHKGCQNG